MNLFGSVGNLRSVQTAMLPRAQEQVEVAGVPKVSVVIPTYNSARMLREAIESILAQTYCNLEMIVVDDGSTDDTADVARHFADRVRYFKQTNQGVSAARNAGIKLARGEYIAFLDADDLWLPEKLQEEIPLLDADPELGLVYCDWAVESNKAVVQKSYLDQLPLRPASGFIFDELVQCGFILTSGVVVRAACLAEVGDFDVSLSIAQDYDLWLRISYRWKVQLVSRCLFTKRSGDGSLSSNLIKTALERIAIFHKTLRNMPEITSRSRRLLKHQLSINYWDVGYSQFDNFSFRGARDNFISSFLYNCTNLKTLVYLAATYLPVSFVRAARKVKRQTHDSV